MAGQGYTERRTSYRLRYPEVRSAVLTIGQFETQVIDVSETGIRFQRPAGLDLAPGEPFVATLRFMSGGCKALFASILRLGTGDAAARLHNGIDFQLLAIERESV